ncbi:MAG: PfkB family carbohydrate kinase [Actinomycetota bacterium]
MERLSRVAVVGHVEWVEFVLVERVPTAGEIVHARDSWALPAGGGAVAAVQLAKLAGGATLYTALGDDELGHRVPDALAAFGVRVETTFRPTPQRRAFTFLDERGERTITVLGDRLGPKATDPLPWEELEDTDAVYFTAGDEAALRQARQARALVSTARVFPLLARANVALDAVVGSARDPDEHYRPAVLDPPPGLVVLTAGAAGGTIETPDGERIAYAPAPLPGPVVDAYGCGDSFAAGLTFGLGAGLPPSGAVELATRCGAACLTGRGPYEGQLRRL